MPLHAWYGVDVGADGRVSRLSLYNNGLTGRIPAEIGGLSELRSLGLGWNELAGSIPTELGDLAALEHLWLQGNDLTGRIPTEIGGLSELRSLGLGWNELAGSIPTGLGDLAALEHLWLEGNDLTGPIPPEIGRLAGLRVLRFGGNDLTGPIPPEIASLAGLRSLELWSNDLTGPIPPSLGNLTSLESLSLAQNDLSGPVPAELARLILLRELAVNGNPQLSGLLPAGFKDLWGLTTLNAGGTALCAPADPDFLAWLGRLQNPRVRRCGNDTLSVYLTQAVQSFEFPVPLVANVPALLRVFLIAPDGEAIAFPPVRARFYLEGAEVHTVDIPRSPGTIPSRLDEGRLEASANVAIPAEVVQPGLELVVEIDPEDTLGPELGITRRIPAAGRHAIDVRAVPALHLTYLPIVRPGRRSAEFLSRVRNLSEADTLFRRVRQWLPVAGFDVALHDIVYTSARTGGELISEIEAIRVLEGGTGYYMGGLPQYLVEDLGYAGSARLAGWASFSRVRSITIAHELGHNMSLEHAPCGSASRPDPGFPTRDGTIGAWGYNPTDNSLVSPETSDLMSYCGPKWISEYSFTKAFDHRLRGEGLGSATATTAGDAPSILLWGGIDGEGVPFLEPAFVVDAPPTLLGPAGPYTLMGRTAEGEGLFLLRFDMQEMADGDGESGFAFALPASPTWADRLATVVLSGPGGTATLRHASGPPAALLRDPRTGRVRGILRDLTSPGSGLATLAGAAADPVSIASFLPDVANLEILISRGLPAAEQWRR
ncbi:leucine-rich repeat domain-containing protein [Candidatus Palauibacter sp.]|uniref:leucine-rich repeat domain-containing protein n=1 Tax=Candidatus Palauibacter sp. TaxID=3101350 RepID=UPI003B027A01